MDWRCKVELFEQIRREYEFGAGTIQGVARKLGVHRRMVREAVRSATPARRKKRERRQVKLLADCRHDEGRVLSGRAESVGNLLLAGKEHSRPTNGRCRRWPSTTSCSPSG